MVCRDSRLIFHNGCSYQQVHPDARPQGVQGCTIPASNAFWGQKAAWQGHPLYPPTARCGNFDLWRNGNDQARDRDQGAAE